MIEIVEQLRTLARGIWRHKWGVMIVAWALAATGWVGVYLLPPSYSAAAKVQVDTRALIGVGDLLARGNLEQHVALMSKTLLVRPNLEQIARMADLDLHAKSAREHDAMLEELAGGIALQSLGRESLFSISFTHRDAQTAKNVVAALVTLFTEGGLRQGRTEFADSLRFLDSKIKEHEEKLLSADNALKDFKRENFDTLPERGQDFYARLVEVGEKLRQAQIELREAQSAREAVRAQVNGEEPILLEEAPGPDTALLDAAREKRIEGLQTHLDNLRLKFTEQHPDIVAVKRVLAELQAQSTQTTASAAAGAVSPPGQTQNLVLPPLKAALTQAEAQVAALQARVEEYTRYLSELKAQLDRVPGVEADLKRLSRDHEVTKANYEQLLAQREKLRLSAQALGGGGLQITLVEPPHVPTLPSSPNRLLLVSLVLLGALGAGVMYGVLRAQLQPMFLDRRALVSLGQRPTLGAVSMIWTPARRREALAPLLAYAASASALLLCYALLMGFYFYAGRLG